MMMPNIGAHQLQTRIVVATGMNAKASDDLVAEARECRHDVNVRIEGEGGS